MKVQLGDKQFSLKAALKKFFGFNEFRGLQEDVINSVLNKENTFVIMPTGGGKSLCYQLPALMMEGTAIVISPLIALMKNQVDAIRGVSNNDGIAHVLNSSLSKTQVQTVIEDITSGVTKLLYVAPESLTKEENVAFLRTITISFMAIDEAHCISEWGHDFRPEYRNLKSISERIGDNIPIIGLTATATPKVQEDILKNLNIPNATTYKASFNRPNLFYEVRQKTEQVDRDIISFVKQNNGKSGIVYCLSRKRVEELAQVLQVNGVNALPYHAGLDTKQRVFNQDSFLKEDCDVIVATIAFGMGIDKPDVRFVIHHDIPKSIESYYHACPIALIQNVFRFNRIKEEGKGALIFINQMQAVDSLLNQLKDISEASPNTVKLDEKDFGIGAQMIHALGINNIQRRYLPPSKQ